MSRVVLVRARANPFQAYQIGSMDVRDLVSNDALGEPRKKGSCLWPEWLIKAWDDERFSVKEGKLQISGMEVSADAWIIYSPKTDTMGVESPESFAQTYERVELQCRHALVPEVIQRRQDGRKEIGFVAPSTYDLKQEGADDSVEFSVSDNSGNTVDITISAKLNGRRVL